MLSESEWGSYPVLKKSYVPASWLALWSEDIESLYLRRWQILTWFALAVARSCGLTKKGRRNQGWLPEGDLICIKSLRAGPGEGILGRGENKT